MTEISVTFKGDGSYGHPWLVFKGASVAEVQAQLSEAHEQDLFTAAGRAHTAYSRGVMMGSKLDATTVKVEKAEEKPKATTTKKSTAKKTTRPAPSKAAQEAEEAAEQPESAEETPQEAPKANPPKGAPKPAWKR